MRHVMHYWRAQAKTKKSRKGARETLKALHNGG
jgi:hypothetical protein